jgi:hypothetical protein
MDEGQAQLLGQRRSSGGVVLQQEQMVCWQ